MGHSDGHLFKYGISKNPENRLASLKRERWCEGIGFDWESAEILFCSDIRPVEHAKHAEALWLLDNRGSSPYAWGYTKEIMVGDCDSLVKEFKSFCEGQASHSYFELSNSWLGSNFGVFNCFRTKCGAIRIYCSSTYRPVIDVAKIIRQNPDLDHIYTFWGSYSWLNMRLKDKAKKVISDDRYYTMEGTCIEEFANDLFLGSEHVISEVLSTPKASFLLPESRANYDAFDQSIDYL